jgi:hypothetical protein
MMNSNKTLLFAIFSESPKKAGSQLSFSSELFLEEVDTLLETGKTSFQCCELASVTTRWEERGPGMCIDSTCELYAYNFYRHTISYIASEAECSLS